VFDLKLSPAQKQLLRDQVIDLDRPGTILRDFQMLLDFLGTEGVPLRASTTCCPSLSEVRIGDVPLKVGDSMQLLYDYGDCWPFDVKLERIEPPRPRMKKAQVLAKHGKAPKQYERWE
jgi:hypothetical protein